MRSKEKMVHEKNNMTAKYEKFIHRPLEERQEAARQQNTKYEERLEESRSRVIWSERGITLGELRTTSIPNTVEIQGWEHYIHTPPLYHEELVREFYAAMVPEVYQSMDIVMVRGCEVVINASLINQYFHIRDFHQVDFSNGLVRDEIFEEDYDRRLAAALRRNVSEIWEPHHNDLYYRELTSDLAFWTVFVKFNLRPSSHRTTISPEVARILFSIHNNYPINVGHIIQKQICYTGHKASGILPFPCLITHFCRAAGIVIHEDLHSPPGNIGRRVYNSFAQEQGLPTLPTRRRHRRPNVAPVQGALEGVHDEDVLPVHMPAPHPQQHQAAERPPWVDEIIARFDAHTALVAAQHAATSEQLENVITRVTHLGSRVTSLEIALRGG